MKSYKINQILNSSEEIQFYIGIFENTPDSIIEFPHRHDFYSIVWFLKGKGFNVIDFNEYEILPTRIFTTNPKQIHNWEYTCDSQGYFVIFDEPFAKQYNVDFQHPFLDISLQDTSFMETILMKASCEKDIQNQHTAVLYFLSLLGKGGNKSQVQNELIFNYKKLITDYIHLNLSVKEYADLLKTDIETLNQLCKTNTGLSAKQLQLDLKITEAKRLLLYTSLSIFEISFQLGFEDSSYFSRIFKKKTSFAPLDFVKKYRK